MDIEKAKEIRDLTNKLDYLSTIKENLNELLSSATSEQPIRIHFSKWDNQDNHPILIFDKRETTSDITVLAIKEIDTKIEVLKRKISAI